VFLTSKGQNITAAGNLQNLKQIKRKKGFEPSTRVGEMFIGLKAKSTHFTAQLRIRKCF
jgi:hypothetical protein